MMIEPTIQERFEAEQIEQIEHWTYCRCGDVPSAIGDLVTRQWGADHVRSIAFLTGLMMGFIRSAIQVARSTGGTRDGLLEMMRHMVNECYDEDDNDSVGETKH